MAGRRNLENLDSYLSEAIANIREDRSMAAMLLTDLAATMKQNEKTHEEVGQIAAKYLETLQRSNEQLVKISALLQKRQAVEGLSDQDKTALYDLIKETG